MNKKLQINKDAKKCFVFDLDGTIIFNNEYLRPSIELLLKDIVNKGHKLIFATGRPYKDFKNVMPEWTHGLPMCLFSGAVTVNEGKVLSSNPLEQVNVQEIIKMCTQFNYPYIMDNFNKYYHPDMEGIQFGFVDANCDMYRERDLKHILQTEIYKILVLEIRALEKFEAYAKANDILVKLHSYDDCFDLVANCSNKYLGVLPFVRDFDDSDVFIFGNDLNDYELFTHFSNSVLFGSLPKLKDLAKVQIHYDEYMDNKFADLINSILNS